MARAVNRIVFAAALGFFASANATIEFWTYQTSAKADQRDFKVHAWLFRDEASHYFLQLKTTWAEDGVAKAQIFCAKPSTTRFKLLYSQDRSFEQENVDSDTLGLLSGTVQPQKVDNDAEKSEAPAVHLNVTWQLKSPLNGEIEVKDLKNTFYDGTTLDGDLAEIESSCENEIENPNLPTRSWVPVPALEKHFVEFIRKSARLKKNTAKQLYVCLKNEFERNIWNSTIFGLWDAELKSKITAACQRKTKQTKTIPTIVLDLVQSSMTRTTMVLPRKTDQYMFSNRFMSAVSYLVDPFAAWVDGTIHFDIEDATNVFVVAPLRTGLKFNGYSAQRGGKIFIERY